MNRISHLFDDESEMRRELAAKLARRLLDVPPYTLKDLAASIEGIVAPVGRKASAQDAAQIFLDIIDLGGDA